MPLKAAYWLLNAVLLPKYYTHALFAVAALVTLYTYAQGRKTNRERDLHARTILITGAFTPLGLSLIDSLARRGAHIIALTAEDVDSGASRVMVGLLRDESNNENIYAEHCDLNSVSSIRTFCTNFVKGEQQRIDAIIFAHEYATIGSIFTKSTEEKDKQRQAASCATFLLTTLLLPALLVAPVERDIRLITLINPFYAAATPFFSNQYAPPSMQAASSPATKSLFVAEGNRALRTAVMMRHLQRILDALPTSSQVPRADTNVPVVPVVSDKVQRSNIVTVTVSPGMSRHDVVAPLLGADLTQKHSVSWRGLVLYLLFNPIFRLIAKNSKSTLQTILHTLFLPTPFKHINATVDNQVETTGDAERDSEVLKPGALYTECAVVRLNMPPPPTPPETDSGEGKKEKEGSDAEVPKKIDDGEMGGEVLGTLVWDEYERELKTWEEEEDRRMKEEKEREANEAKERGIPTINIRPSTPPTVDVDAADN